MSQFKCKYQVGDGYVGGNRPQFFTIDESEIDSEMDELSLVCLFDDVMQDHFEQNIHPEPLGDSREEFIAWAKDIIAKTKE